MPSTIKQPEPQAFRLDRARSVFDHHGRHDDLVQQSGPPGIFAGPDELAELLADLRVCADHLGLDFYRALNDSYQLYIVAKQPHQVLRSVLNFPSSATA